MPKCLQAICYFIFLSAGLALPVQSLADSFQVKPVFEFDTEDRIKSIDSIKANDTVGADGLFKQSASGETGACNQAIQAIGTYTNQNIKATVCHGSGSEKCEQRIFRSAKIVGGAIARTTDGETKPVLVSQVNEYANPGQQKLKTCGSSVSWDPANNQQFLNKTEYIQNSGMTQKFHAGDKNPQYVSGTGAKVTY